MKKKNTVKNCIVGVLTVLLVVAVLSFAFTQARYSDETTPDNHLGELDYTLANQVIVYNTQQFFAAVENGYSNIKIADTVSNPFMISGSAEVKSDIILDVNGHQIQRNNREPMLTIKEGVRMIVTDTAKSQEGSFYNPVGSVLKIDGGVLTVMSNKFESGPRKNEYLSSSETPGEPYIGGTISQNDSSISVYEKSADGSGYVSSSNKTAPIILPYVEKRAQGAVVNGKSYYVNGNIYFDKQPTLSNDLLPNKENPDTYLYFTIDDQNVSSATIMQTDSTADFYYSYYIENTVHTENDPPVYQYVGPTSTKASDIEVKIYGYYNDIASARNEVEPYKTTPSNFAAIKMVNGSMHARGGEFYSYFGVESSSCIYADEGNLAVYDGKYTATESGVGIKCNYLKNDSTFTISGGHFQSYKGDTIQMLNGAMTITGGTFVKDSMAYTDSTAGTNNNNAAINLINGSMRLLSSDATPINFYLAGKHMAGIMCGPNASIYSLGVNYQFGTTDGNNSFSGGNNIGIMSEGGDITVDNCTFIQPGDTSYGIYSFDNSDDTTIQNDIDVFSTIFSMGGENSTGIYAKGGIINIGAEEDMYKPDNKAEVVNAAGEVVEGVSIDNYTIFYLDHVANCYGVYIESGTEALVGRAMPPHVNIYSGQFFIGGGFDSNNVTYASKEIPGNKRDDGTEYQAHGGYDAEGNLITYTRDYIQTNEMVWSAGVYLNDSSATVKLGKLRMIIGGYYSAGIFAERGTVDKLYDVELDKQYNGVAATEENLPTAVFFIGTTARGYANGGIVRPYATEKSQKWAYLYKRAQDYYQTKDYRTHYDRIDPTDSSDNYGICAKEGQVKLGRIYINLRSVYSRGIFATTSADSTSSISSSVVVDDYMANIDCMEFDAASNKYVLPEVLSSTLITVRNGNVSIKDADVRTNSFGIMVNNGRLEFTGNIKFEAINSTAVYMTSTVVASGVGSSLHNDFIISETAKVSIFCNIREKSDTELTKQYPVKFKNFHSREGTAETDYLASKNGVNIKGGSFQCDGELDIDFHGLNNDNQPKYDAYNIPLTSAALNVEQLSDQHAPVVNIWHAHFETGKVYDDTDPRKADVSLSNGGGGITVKGGTVHLGKRRQDFTEANAKVYREAHNSNLNELISIHTYGKERYNDLLGTHDNWNYKVSKTGGPGIKVENGSIDVNYGTYYASQGNGIVLLGGTATVHRGIFKGKNEEWTKGEGDSTGSGLGSYYGFMLRGGGTLTINGGLFEGFNGGAFITGTSATHLATAIVNGGTFEDMPERRHERFTTNGFSVGPFSDVTIGMENRPADVEPPKIRGLACGIAVENNWSFGSVNRLDPNVTITIQGGAIIRAMKGGRTDVINAIWQGNTNATIILRDCSLRQQNFKLIRDEYNNIIGFETDANGNIIDDVAIVDRVINTGDSKTWVDFVDPNYTITAYSSLNDKDGTPIVRTSNVNWPSYYKIVVKRTGTPTEVKVDKANVELEANEATLEALKGKINVKVLYSDNSELTVNGYTVDGFDPKATGEQTVTVSHSGLSTTIKVTVKEPAPKSLIVEPTEVTLLEGNATLDSLKGKIAVNVVYSDNSEKTVTDYTVEGFTENAVGEQTVTIKHSGLSKTITVNVVAIPKSLSVTPSEVTLNQGSATLDALKGQITVKVVYSNDSEATVTDYTVEDFTPNAVGTQNVTINHSGLNATVKVTVVPTPKSLKVEPTEVTLNQGSATLDALKGQIAVKVSYSDNTEKTVTDYTVEGFTENKVGTQTVTINHSGSGLSTTVKVTVVPTPKSLSVTPSEVTLNHSSATLDALKGQITVKVVYSDNTEKTVTDYTVEGFTENAVGTQTVTIKHSGSGLSTTITVNVVAIPKSLNVTPSEVTLNHGSATLEALKGQITVKVVYSDNTEKTVSDYAVEGFTENAVGTQTVTIKHSGLSTTVKVTVVRTPVSLNVNPEVVTMTEAEATSVDGLKAKFTVKVVYSNNTEKSVTDYTVEGFDATTEGAQTVTIKHSGLSVNVTVTVDHTVTLYYKNVNGWTNVNCYAYGDKTENGAWPGVAMTAVGGHEGWYQITVSNKFTTVVFNDGTNQTGNLAVDKANTYYDGTAWTDGFGITKDSNVTIEVGKTVVNATLNESAEVGKIEFMALSVALNKDDVVVIKVDGKTFNNYKAESPFQGTVEKTAKYDFYISAEGIYASESNPEITTDSKVTIVVGEKVTNATLNMEAEAGKIEFMATAVALNVGDVVVVKVGEAEFKGYKTESQFKGTATKAGLYDFYISAEGIYAGEHVDPEIKTNSKVTLEVGGNVVNATLNTQADGGKIEFMAIDVALAKDDVVVIKVDGKVFINYKAESPFKDKAPIADSYSFYIANDGVWVTKATDYIVVNGSVYYNLEVNPDNPSEQMVKGVDLKAGDTVQIFVAGTQQTNYEAGCNFTGTATKAGLHDFYVKSTSIWVTVPTA